MAIISQVRKMQLNKIKISKKQKEGLSAFFADIIERHMYGGDMHAMMLEAYVLGFHHCLSVSSAEYTKSINEEEK